MLVLLDPRFVTIDEKAIETVTVADRDGLGLDSVLPDLVAVQQKAVVGELIDLRRVVWLALDSYEKRMKL